MKKIVSAFLTAALAVSMLVGCGSGNAGAGEEEAEDGE